MKKSIYILLLSLYLILFTQYSFAQNPGDNTFKSSVLHNINIKFTQPNFFDSLMRYKQHADSFNISTQNMMAAVTIDGTPVDSIGIKFKGNSTFGCCGRKRPIRLTFNHYIAGRKFDKLTVLELNNNVLDPSEMREKLMLDFMNKKGLPAPRCTYAKVSFNGQYVGLYKMMEQVDKEFIITHYQNWGGNLFKGDPQGTLTWINNKPSSYYNYYELHSNTILNNWRDLVTLIGTINNTPATVFYDTLENHLNTTPLIKQWAARNIFVDLDSYFHAPHNYYLYHNILTNKFEWNTWDVSVSFGFYPFWKEDSTERSGILMSSFPLTTRMLANTTYRTTYLNTICDYLTYFSNTVLDLQIDSLANVIRPAILLEPDSNNMFPKYMFDWSLDTFTVRTPIGDIPGLKKFIGKRRASIISQLALLPFTCTVGVKELGIKNTELRIYPNPSVGIFNLNIEEEDVSLSKSGGQIEIYNVFGEKIYAELFSAVHTTIDISDKPNGIYFINLKDMQLKTVAAKKIVVQH